MSIRTQIVGIYDKRTLKALLELGIYDVGFDFRPKSFNFLQKHQFLSLIKNVLSPLHRITLHFESEKDFMVNDLLGSVRSLLEENEMLGISFDQFCLEFSGGESLKFCDQFEMPFNYHYKSDAPIKEILEARHINALSLNGPFLDDLESFGKLDSFVRNFYQLFFQAQAKKNLGLFLEIDWGMEPSSKTFDCFDFDGVGLSINKKVESCYRNVDLNGLRSHLGNLLS